MFSCSHTNQIISRSIIEKWSIMAFLLKYYEEALGSCMYLPNNFFLCANICTIFGGGIENPILLRRSPLKNS